jgi:hypothetical protein
MGIKKKFGNKKGYNQLNIYNKTTKAHSSYTVHQLIASSFKILQHETLDEDETGFGYTEGMQASDFAGRTSWSGDYVIDHVDHNKENNDVWNLRVLPTRLNTLRESAT